MEPSSPENDVIDGDVVVDMDALAKKAFDVVD